MFIQHPRLAFDDLSHTYKWDGVVKPSVTQILSSVSVKGKPIADNRFFGTDTTARDFGVAFHKMAAMMYKGESFNFPDEMKPWYDTLTLFRKNYSFLIPLYYHGRPMVEQAMYHEALGYCGTPDLICEVSNDCPAYWKRAFVILDWKTSVQEMGHWRFQTAAYAQLFKDVCDESFVGKRIITMSVRFDDVTYHSASRAGAEVKADWNYFLSTLNVYKGAV